MLVDRTIDRCKKDGFKSVLFTFDMPRKCIYPKNQKLELIEKSGIDVCIMYPFDVRTAQMEPEEFIEQVLVGQLGIKQMIVGSDFCFGHNRRGNIHMLVDNAGIFGYDVEVAQKLRIDGRIVSSTLIKEFLSKGDIKNAVKYLGRNYVMEGVVTCGKKLGRTIGFPTANILPEDEVIMPRYGVYKTKVFVRGMVKPGITNIGCRPTVGGENVSVETFIKDFSGNIYGEKICVEFEYFIRPERKFATVDALKSQIYEDISQI